MGHPPSHHKKRHDSVIQPLSNSNDDEEEEEEVQVDTVDGRDTVWMKGCDRYSQTKIFYQDDCDVKGNPVSKHPGQHSAACYDDDCGNWIDERAGEPGYVPGRGRVGKWAKVASSEQAGSRNEEHAQATESKEAMRSQQLQEWTANLRNREHAAIDATVGKLEKLAEPVAAVLARQTEAEIRERSHLRSIVEGNEESVLVMYTTNKWFPGIICQYPLCALPNRNISAVGGTYISLENFGDEKDLVRGPDIELDVGGATEKRVIVYVRGGSFGGFKTGSPGVHGTFCIPCLKDLYLKHVVA